MAAVQVYTDEMKCRNKTGQKGHSEGRKQLSFFLRKAK